jgi:hypothetical protein
MVEYFEDAEQIFYMAQQLLENLKQDERKIRGVLFE